MSRAPSPGTVALPRANWTEAIRRLRKPGSLSSTMRARVSSSRCCVDSAARARRSNPAARIPRPMSTPVRVSRGRSTTQSTARNRPSPRRVTLIATAIRRTNSTRTSFQRTAASFRRSLAPSSSGRAVDDDGGRSLIYFNSETLRTIHSIVMNRMRSPKNRGEDQRSTSLKLVRRAVRLVRDAGNSSSWASGR